MEFQSRCAMYIIAAAIVSECISGVMFQFHPLDVPANWTNQESICKGLGYEGLAVIIDPEAYNYAMKITEHSRITLAMGVYLGGRYRPELDLFAWDDGTIITPDAPLDTANMGDPTSRFYLMKRSGLLVQSTGQDLKLGLCGNHKNPPGESRGTTTRGQMVATVKPILSVSQLPTYVECVLTCSLDHECRAVEYDLDLLSCSLIGQYTSTGVTPNPRIFTYVREVFSVQVDTAVKKKGKGH
ncbi:hypothetical protein EGW08_000447 [Elysia chlorotica]|uniref:Apple domain-containing protein n=1 Tax=Elysia chlorotica TaxID=188477 RepID=A0A3S1BV10_ELYCH|nr:hypothetical protein EGW08_000447 [Elysia chlorotica]